MKIISTNLLLIVPGLGKRGEWTKAAPLVPPSHNVVLFPLSGQLFPCVIVGPPFYTNKIISNQNNSESNFFANYIQKKFLIFHICLFQFNFVHFKFGQICIRNLTMDIFSLTLTSVLKMMIELS